MKDNIVITEKLLIEFMKYLLKYSWNLLNSTR